MAKKSEYISKAVTTTIKASSRRSIGIQTRSSTEYYTVEYTEERTVPEDCDIDKEKTFLWDTVNSAVDEQIEDILDVYKKKN